MPFLICRHLDKRTEWRVVVNEDSFTVGYSEAATVPIADSSLAAKEIFVSKADGRYFFRDLAEKNRVLLNDALAREGLLKDGDRLRLGRVSLLFFDDPPREAGEVDLFREEAEVEADFRREGALEAGNVDVEARGDGFPGDGFPVHGSSVDGFPREGMGKLWRYFLVSGSLGLGILLGFATTRQDLVLSSAPKPPGKARAPDAKALAPSSLEEKASPTPPVARTPAAPLDPVASRGAFFRQFLDLAERPPTRGEERELFPLEPEAQKPRILEIAARENSSPRPRVPAENTVRAEKRRERSPNQRAKSFLVDCLDRPPASPAEVALVTEALKAQGAALDVARTLVFSIECRLRPIEAGSAQDTGKWWEEEFFRFFLRPPTALERQEISPILERMPREKRRRWLVVALASLPEYEGY